MKSKFPSLEQTLVLIKPDGVKRGLVGKIYSRFEQQGLKMVACSMITATKAQARGNYPGTKEWMMNMAEKTFQNYEGHESEIMEDLGTDNKELLGQKIFDSLVNSITDGPIILSVWEGNHAVKVIRKLAGATIPAEALPGTIRGDFGFDSPLLASKAGRISFQNIIHVSDSEEESKREIEHWFAGKFKYLGDYLRTDSIGTFEAFK